MLCAWLCARFVRRPFVRALCAAFRCRFVRALLRSPALAFSLGCLSGAGCCVPFAALAGPFSACSVALCVFRVPGGCFVHALCVLGSQGLLLLLFDARAYVSAFCVPGGCFVHVLCAMLHRGLGSRARCARRGVFVGVLSLRGPCACHRRHHCGFGARLALLLLGAGARCYTVLLGARPSGFKRARVRNCFVRGPCAFGALCFVRRCALCARFVRNN